MDDPAFKAKYKKYKYKVKLWEKQFKEKNGRVPSKLDIREAPTTIRDSYKMYYKLKTSFLETTLSEALEDDAFDLSLLESSQNGSMLSNSISDLSTRDLTALTSDTSSIISHENSSLAVEASSSVQMLTASDSAISLSRCDTQIGDEFEAEQFESLNEKAWELSRKNSNLTEKTEKSTSSNGATLRKSMSDKLFRNASFAKRNPRKSLSRSSLTASQSSQSLIGSQSETLPDLETILSQKARDSESNLTMEMSTDKLPIETKAVKSAMNIDQEWLNRCNQSNNLSSEEVKMETSTMTQSQSQSHIYGLSNINVTALKSMEAATVSSVDKRTTLTFGMDSMSLASMASSMSVADVKEAKTMPCLIDDDEDEIANSEEENEDHAKTKIKSLRKSLGKRKFSEIDEKIEKETDKKSNPRVANNPVPRPTKTATRKTKKASKPAPATTVTRRSARTVAAKIQNTNYAEVNGCDSNVEQEEDPFACDSDDDPDFSAEPKKSSKNVDESENSSNDENDESKVAKKQTKQRRATKTKVIRKKAVAKPSAPVTRRTRIATKKSSEAKSDEVEDEETPDNYLIEFGIDKIQSVPRINVDELTRTTEKFAEYIHSEVPATVAKASIKSKSLSAGQPLVTKNSLAREKLEKKIAAGKINENFVRINLQKKIYARGKKTVNFSRYKKQQWRNKKAAAALTGPNQDMSGCDGGILVCFQCGLPGHFAQNCKLKSDRLLPLTGEIEESQFPTLEEVDQMSKNSRATTHVGRLAPAVDNPTWREDVSNDEDETENDETDVDTGKEMLKKTLDAPKYIGHAIPEGFLIKAGMLNDDGSDDSQVKPIYPLKANGKLPATPKEVFEALKMFGHTNFRPGQEQAVMRILGGLSTLVTLSTGSGKSLCYQLPAYLYSKHMKCITLVISPLVSLMEDQVHHVPHFLNAQCLHTGQTKAKRESIMAAIKAGDVHVLLISPEAIVAGEKSTGFGSILRDLPPIAFVCIDEAHCVSQWSHNFRPSYLMVCRVLYEKLKVKTVLGLTATATISTRQSIVRHLMIPDGLSGVISDIPLPDNLLLTASCEENRDAALIRLLQSDRFTEFNSIIVYCSRRDECERVAKKLTTYFQDSIALELKQKNASGKRRRPLKTTIKSYHAGMEASRRRTIQNEFMRGDLKIVVATIAFGMGINKADIRAVIHYNMPMNFESYVQEVGRAGRDGKPAHCHLFLDPRGSDRLELRRHIYANSIDRHIIRRLLRKIFVPCACKRPNEANDDTNETTLEADLKAIQAIEWNDDFFGESEEKKKRSCPGHEVCFSVDKTVFELDIPEENISTLLCYLELHEKRYIKALSKAYTYCKVFSYGGPKALKAAAINCPPLAMAIALDMKKGISHETSTFIEFPVIDIASAIGWNSGVVKYQLKNLEWITIDGLPKRSTISVEFYDLGFRVLAPGDLSDFELDSTLDLLYSRVKSQEQNQLEQLENVFRGLTSIAVSNCVVSATAEQNDERSEKLKKNIREYFQSTEKRENILIEDSAEDPKEAASDDQLISDIRTMIARYPENNFTGRALARIFHGVQSPVYQAVIWSRCKYWREHIKTDFNRIVQLANKEILRIRT